jgi:hypothetical protein
MKKKQESYDLVIEMFKNMATTNEGGRKDVAIVSNCGDILRTKKGDTSWLGTPLEYEDLEWP